MVHDSNASEDDVRTVPGGGVAVEVGSGGVAVTGSVALADGLEFARVVDT